MKLIIEIPDEDYKFVKELAYVGLARGNTKTIQKHIIDAIKQGELYDGTQGEWIERLDYNRDTYYDCSVCGNSWTTIEGTPWENGMNFCPNCGAKMKKAARNE